MDRLIWENPSRPPGPCQWASKTRQQLNATYDFVYWMTNNPKKVRSDNRKVLQAHTERHLKLMKQGGEQREGIYGGGAYTINHGSFGKETQGSIPRNILRFSHNCADQNEYKRRSRELGLPTHTAPMPISLPEFLIKLLTVKEEVVADPFFGSGTTGKAAEKLGRRWVGSEIMVESAIGASTRFEHAPGFEHYFGDWKRGRPH